MQTNDIVDQGNEKSSSLPKDHQQFLINAMK